MKGQPTGKKSKLFPAYTDNRPTFTKRGESGIYLIYDIDKNLKYVGYSESDLYKALYRHFQSWVDRTQRRFTYSRAHLVRVILTTPHRAHLLEKFLIQKMKPADGILKYYDYLSKNEEKTVVKIAEGITPASDDDFSQWIAQEQEKLKGHKPSAKVKFKRR